MKNYLTYEAAALIISKPFLGSDAKGINKTQLQALLGTIRVREEEALHNASYYAFLANWVEGQQLVMDTELGRTEFTTAVATKLKNFDEDLDGITREIAYYHSYSWDASSELAVFRLEQVWGRFDSVITNNYIQQLLETKRNSMTQTFIPYNVAGRIRELSVDSALSSNLLAILEKEKGNFVYVDFWGKWCAPCMAEMPHARSFIEQLNGKPIRFLFLSVKTSANDSKAVQQKFSIPGTFIALNDIETDIVNQAFGFASYPSNFIIDPGGNLVTKNIKVLNVKDKVDLILMLMKREKIAQ
jgi:thiol-disulfide isomerase/thioredoxin